MAKGIQPPKSRPDFLVMARARIEVKGGGFEIALRFPADPMSKELREIKLPSRDVRITGLDSKGIEINTLAKTLTKFTPIYVTIRPEPIDPFWLLNAKAGTLIFTVEPQKLFAPPTQPPVAPTDPDDSPKPSTPYGNLGTALAKVEAQGKQLTVTVRDVNFEMVDRQIEVMVFEESVKEINGKQVVTKTPRKEIRTVPFPVPKGFRDIKLSAKDVKVFDLKGKPFPQDQLATRFAEFSPITVTMDEATGNDAFWMATSKDGTLVFVVEPAKLRPTSGSNNPMGPQASDDEKAEAKGKKAGTATIGNPGDKNR